MANKLEVLLVQPGKYPKAIAIDGTLEALQQAVGGDIQAAYPFEDAVAVVCNEEGKLIGLPPNRAIKDENGKTYDFLVGDFLVVGLGESEFCSLSPEMMEKYKKVYYQPEFFVVANGRLVAYPMPQLVSDLRLRQPEQHRD